MYVHGSEKRLIHAARGEKIDGLKSASVLKRSKKEKKLEDQCWAWLQNGDLKKQKVL